MLWLWLSLVYQLNRRMLVDIESFGGWVAMWDIIFSASPGWNHGWLLLAGLSGIRSLLEASSDGARGTASKVSRSLGSAH